MEKTQPHFKKNGTILKLIVLKNKNLHLNKMPNISQFVLIQWDKIKKLMKKLVNILMILLYFILKVGKKNKGNYCLLILIDNLIILKQYRNHFNWNHLKQLKIGKIKKMLLLKKFNQYMMEKKMNIRKKKKNI